MPTPPAPPVAACALDLAAVDVQYQDDRASAACLTFRAWEDEKPAREVQTFLHGVAEYEPGRFWRRELPCLRAVLALLDGLPHVIVIDGYVWLDGNGRKGLGAHLFEALGGRAAVISVAKHSFHGASHCVEVRRGKSPRPLYVTAEGIPLAEAARAVTSMHGEHRTPTLLKRVDRLCREAFL
jgi:deoxyribonuclease V